MSAPMQVIAGSDGSTYISDMAVVTKDAAGGVYPMRYTLWYRGTYVMNVVGPTGQVRQNIYRRKSQLLATTEVHELGWSKGTSESEGFRWRFLCDDWVDFNCLVLSCAYKRASNATESLHVGKCKMSSTMLPCVEPCLK